MASLRTFAVAGLFLGLSAFVYACVGDDPIQQREPDDAGADGTTNPPGTPPPGTPGADGGTDGSAPGCGDGGIICAGVCAEDDPKNCGRCGHDCGKGACKSGVCQPILVAGDPDGGANITSVTTDQTDDNPKAVAQHVFWSASGAGGGVFQDNVIGGNTITLSTASVAIQSNVVVSGSTAYWFAQNFGGSPQPVLKGSVNLAASQASVGIMNCSQIQSILYDPLSQNVVGSYAVNTTTFGAFKCGPGGGVACTSITTFTGKPGGNIATDGTLAYFADTDNGLIQKTTLGGGAVGTYVSGQATPNLIRVDASNVYWSNSGTKTLQRSVLDSALTPKQLASTTTAADGIAADAVNVYWTEHTSGTVSFAPITGAGPSTPYATLGPSPTPMRIVRDTGFLYFSHKGAIYRVALP